MSSSRLALFALAAAIGIAWLVPAETLAASSARPTASIKPRTVKVGATALLTGKNFLGRDQWFFLVVVPDLVKPAAERFIGTAHPAKNGTVKLTVKFPIEPSCGRASIYAYSISTQKTAVKVASVTLKGCKAASAKPSSPPPSPPGNRKPPKAPKP